MALQPHPVGNFDRLIRQLIKAGEGLEPLPYAVNAGSPIGDHTITIGYGYTMVRRGRLPTGRIGWAPYGRLDADLRASRIIPPDLTPAISAEITAVAQALNRGRNDLADQAIARLRNLWTQRFGGGLSQDQADALFGRAAVTALDEVRGRFMRVLGVMPGDLLYNTLLNTREMAALLSRAYRGQSTISRGLVDALNRSDRAEAWFIIRYERSGQGHSQSRCAAFEAT